MLGVGRDLCGSPSPTPQSWLLEWPRGGDYVPQNTRRPFPQRWEFKVRAANLQQCYVQNSDSKHTQRVIKKQITGETLTAALDGRSLCFPCFKRLERSTAVEDARCGSWAGAFCWEVVQLPGTPGSPPLPAFTCRRFCLPVVPRQHGMRSGSCARLRAAPFRETLPLASTLTAGWHHTTVWAGADRQTPSTPKQM